MTNVLEYVFEELPLALIDGFDAGEINGSAEIDYDRGGQWVIKAVYLDGSKRRPLTEEEKLLRRLQKMPALTHTTDRKPVDLAGHPLELMVRRVLELHRWFSIQEAVREQLERDREIAMETAGDRR